jgi:hypothetical protein
MTDGGDWIYLEYMRGNMMVASNNAELMAIVTTEATKMADEQFILRVGSEKAKDNFLKKNDADPDE